MMLILLEAAARAVVLALVVASGLRLAGVRNVLAQKLAWALVLVAAILMPLAMQWPVLHPVIHRTQAVGPVVAPVVAPVATPVVEPALAEQSEPVQVASAPMAPPAFVAHAPLPSAPHKAPMAVRLDDVAAFVYALVAALLVARLVVGVAVSLRLWMEAEPVRLPTLDALRMDGIRVRATTETLTPVTVASGILLPANWQQWDEQRLAIVLAHEAEHVRQGDFYLQLAASLYAAVLWISPLGWWLRRKLADLAETISDRAGMEAAQSAPDYAAVLLDFAAMPRPTVTGVAMARTSNLAVRIERLLCESKFRQSFAGGRLRQTLAVLLVPVALVGATAGFRVEAAAQQQTTVTQPTQATESAQARSAENAVTNTTTATTSPADATKSVTVVTSSGAVTPEPGSKRQSATFSFAQQNNGDSWAYVENPQAEMHVAGIDGRIAADLDRLRKQAKGPYIWFTRGGKTYIIDDPATVARMREQIALPVRFTVKVDPVQIEKQVAKAELALKSIDEKALNEKLANLSATLNKVQADLAAHPIQIDEKHLEQSMAELEKKMAEVERTVPRSITVTVDADRINEQVKAELLASKAQMASVQVQLEQTAKARDEALQQHARAQSEAMEQILKESVEKGTARELP